MWQAWTGSRLRAGGRREGGAGHCGGRTTFASCDVTALNRKLLRADGRRAGGAGHCGGCVSVTSCDETSLKGKPPRGWRTGHWGAGHCGGGSSFASCDVTVLNRKLPRGWRTARGWSWVSRRLRLGHVLCHRRPKPEAALGLTDGAFRSWALRRLFSALSCGAGHPSARPLNVGDCRGGARWQGPWSSSVLRVCLRECRVWGDD